MKALEAGRLQLGRVYGDVHSLVWGQEDRGVSSGRGSLEEESIQLFAAPILGCCQSLSLRHLVILLAWGLCSALSFALTR